MREFECSSLSGWVYVFVCVCVSAGQRVGGRVVCVCLCVVCVCVCVCVCVRAGRRVGGRGNAGQGVNLRLGFVNVQGLKKSYE